MTEKLGEAYNVPEVKLMSQEFDYYFEQLQQNKQCDEDVLREMCASEPYMRRFLQDAYVVIYVFADDRGTAIPQVFHHQEISTPL